MDESLDDAGREAAFEENSNRLCSQVRNLFDAVEDTMDEVPMCVLQFLVGWDGHWGNRFVGMCVVALYRLRFCVTLTDVPQRGSRLVQYSLQRGEREVSGVGAPVGRRAVFPQVPVSADGGGGPKIPAYVSRACDSDSDQVPLLLVRQRC